MKPGTMAGVPPESDDVSKVADEENTSCEPSTSREDVAEANVVPYADESFGGARPKVRRLNETFDKGHKGLSANGKGSHHHGPDSKAVVIGDEASEPEELVKQVGDKL
jgi:hypothetical protein